MKLAFYTKLHLPGISSMSKLGHLSLAQVFEEKRVKNAQSCLPVLQPKAITIPGPNSTR